LKKTFSFIFLLTLGLSAFAHPMTPTTASTQITLQNNTSGNLTIDTGQVHVNNIKNDSLNPKLPDVISSASYHGTATESQNGANYSFKIPVSFPNHGDVCDVNVKYNADNDRVSVTTSAVKFGQHALCSASITQQGSKNSITVNFTEQ